jgi:predicted transcriptional regulator
MARKKTPHLTDSELRLMDVLWERGSATVADVLDAMPKSIPLAYSTVLTTLRILESKGYLKHSKEGRAFVYRPAVARDHERQRAVSHLLRRFFDGSAEALMLNLIEREKVSPEELERLRRRIAEEES